MQILDYIRSYYKSVCEAYRIGNIESSYNTPIIALLTGFGCTARDMSGERSGRTGENVDIKLWRTDEDIAETEPFACVEVKKVDGIGNPLVVGRQKNLYEAFLTYYDPALRKSHSKNIIDRRDRGQLC